MGKKSWTVDWSKVDWSKNNAEIARELNVDTSSVWSKRKNLGLASSTKKINSGIENLPNGAAINWDKTKRFKDGNSIRRIFCLRCGICKQWRMVRTVNIGKIRQGKMSICLLCSKIIRSGQSKTGMVGKHYNSSGYIVCLLDFFSEKEQKILKPMSVTHNGKRNPEILEHRAIMALSLKRPLLSNEVVHHINGVKDDNRIENLELLNRNEHSGEHRKLLLELRKLKIENKKLKEKLVAAEIF